MGRLVRISYIEPPLYSPIPGVLGGSSWHSLFSIVCAGRRGGEIANSHRGRSLDLLMATTRKGRQITFVSRRWEGLEAPKFAFRVSLC